jgi:hypothetical protein
MLDAGGIRFLADAVAHTNNRKTSMVWNRDRLARAYSLKESIAAGSAHDYRRWMLPRAWIEPHLPSGRRPLSAQSTGSHGINGLVRAYLHAVNDAIDECDSAELPGVIDNFCRLLALACGGVAWRPMRRIHAGKSVEEMLSQSRRRAAIQIHEAIHHNAIRVQPMLAQ